jgi:peptidoglycan biosynthesis protein MviN/MurJ (putative lipid II flippase)
MFAITIGTVLVPTLSRYAVDLDMERFRETLSLGVRQIFFVSLPFVAWFAVVPHSIVQLIYRDATRPPAKSPPFDSLATAFTQN